ncbi:superoxide dismutase family protein Rsod isoform X1 [Anticarsia gemmatalis]|uniref:superoxide dismutase family protein Rsod isoform X1 n=1 Tax=Anticarsia gemmatalis TaxID=129554 RepID=UPI003F7573DF
MFYNNSHVRPKIWSVLLFVLLCVELSKCLVLRAYLSQHGLHGEVEFSYKNDSLISIRTNLKPTLQYPDGVWRWTIHEFPVDYRYLTEDRCSDAHLGKEVIDLTEELGYLIIPGKDHAEFESKHTLTGPKGLWGKSIVFETAERDRIICASILSTDKTYEKNAIAKFTSPVAGTLHFRWLSAREIDDYDSYIQADLYHTKAVTEKGPFTEHKWKLFVTDIFDADKGNYEDNCNVLQLVFDPENSGDGMSVGDLDSRLGLIKIASDANVMKTKTLFKDEVINVLRNDMEVTRRSLYVVIYDNKHSDSFLACAKLRPIQPKSTKALINMDGIRGTVEFTQRSPFDPTWTNFQLGAADQDYESNLRFVSSVTQYYVRELPPRIQEAEDVQNVCNTTGALYNPMKIDMKDIPPPGMGTQDQYPVGDLLGKHKDRTEYLNHKYLLPGLANELSGAYWDVYLPLQGPHSVVHRAMVVHRRDPKPDICGTVLLYEADTEYQTPMTSAQVIFRYPIVGRVVFRQPQDRPWEDTVVIVESMVHADGASVNNSAEHRWAIHEHAPGADYYNWTARCLSAGKVYQPHALDIDTRHPESYCRPGLEGLCRVGDFTTRHGTLSIAGKKVDSARLTRRLFTDSVISLAGKFAIMRKSLVIYDDHGPVARGERMACSIVNGLHRRKAVVREWFGNGEPAPLKGRIEMTQQSEYDITNVQVNLDYLDDVNNYKIHVVPVERDLEFPCEKTTLYDTFNPYHVNKSRSPPPLKGTADQYELGDLGIKYGMIDSRSLNTYYNETQVTLFGPYSILGRSVVLHRKQNHRRWACSSIERGYSPSEARELRAIASFHHPGGFAHGYIRMTQLIHNDGSASDTVIEVKLRHPGVRDTNLTRHHNWAIFVNPVGVDAAVKVTNTRCVAGGYRWNPYFTQLADPLNHDLYNQECGADNPLRCDVGDLTARLGTITIGGKREMFMDSNFPLEGTVSAVGRSIVIFGPERSSERFACANIEPDKDIIKYVNIMKPPRFVLGMFLEEMRRVMGVPEWMLSVDARRTRTLHGGTCIQLLLHFTGPQANRLELDFTRLLASGRLDSPSIFIPGFVNTKRKKTISYRQCGVTDPNDRKKSSFFFSNNQSSGVSSRLLGGVAALCALAHLLLH